MDEWKSGPPADPVLTNLLAPLSVFYEDPEISEIAVCAPNVLFLRFRKPDPSGQLWKATNAPELDHGFLTQALSFFANTYNEEFNERNPVLNGILPGGHRLCAVMGKSVVYDDPLPEGGIALCIRQEGIMKGSLDDYGGIGERYSKRKRAKAQIDGGITGDPALGELVRKVADAEIPLIVSGETNSGKTHLLRILINRIPLHARVLTVEDTHELKIPHPNRVHIVTARDKRSEARNPGSITQAEAVDACNRMTPDCIVVGEIGTGNAANAYGIMLTGHGHFMTSIHAGSPKDVPESFVERIRLGGGEVDQDRMEKSLLEKVAVIQMKKTETGERIIDDVYVPPGVSL